MSSAQPKILLTGATGYIGGSILAHLLAPSTTSTLEQAPITLLLRGEDRASELRSAYGDRVHPLVYSGLDDTEATIAIAAQHDIVINTTIGWHPTSAAALIRGLAQRKAATGHDVWMVHTSGTSNLADQPMSGKWIEDIPGREFDDATSDIYGYEKKREGKVQYAQRTAELAVVDTGLELGVKTLVIMSPTIFGRGSGLFNSSSIQIPAVVRGVLAQGHGIVLGDGKGVWDHVHVEDLAELYKVVVMQILENSGKNLPSGKHGIIFSGNGRHSWLEVSQRVTDACVEMGKITDNHVRRVSLGEGTRILSEHFMGADEDMLELGIVSTSRTLSNVGRRLGWKPTRGEDAWIQGFKDDVEVTLRRIGTV